MSVATRCDRCGKFEKSQDGPELRAAIPAKWIALSFETPRILESEKGNLVGRVDLCFECRTEFTKFMQHYIDLARG